MITVIIEARIGGTIEAMATELNLVTIHIVAIIVGKSGPQKMVAVE
jgi:hypothetical protein